MPALLLVDQLHVQRQQQSVLRGVSFAVGAGELVGVLGPNGAGKTSLLLAINQELPSQGTLQLAGQALATQTSVQRAKQLVLLPQQQTAPDALTVRQFVALGRLPYLHWYSPLDDHAAEIDNALSQFDLEALQHRRCEQLSGGEWQRCQLARLAAQQAPLWLLDEPANHLDVRHQHQLLAQLKRQQRSVVASFHDLTLAAWYCDKLLLLANGEQRAFGTPADVLQADLLSDVYQCPCDVSFDAQQQRLRVQFFPPKELA